MAEDKTGGEGKSEFLEGSVAPAASRLSDGTLAGSRSTGDEVRTVALGAPTPDEATPDDEPPASLPPNAAQRERFVDGHELGRGGMGTVRKVFDSVLRRDLAMKVINPEAELSRSAISQFLEEAQVTAQLEHPNIVPVHDLGSAYGDSGMFFTMKRLTGTTLTSAIRSLRGTHPSHDDLIRILRVVLKVCDALEFAHGRGVVHCDLKPENIMIGSHGQAYVMDWGVAVLRSSGQSDAAAAAGWLTLPSAKARLPGSVIGTPAYMAPEQAMGLTEEIDERTDVYGLGAVLYEILTGRSPNQGNNPMAVLSSAVLGEVAAPKGADIWDELPPGLCQIAMKALAKEKSERYESVASLRQDLERFLDGGGWFATQQFNRGDVIVAEGHEADTAYIIERGECQVFKLMGTRQVSVGHLVAGDVFGETAALSTGVRTATVLAKDEVTVRLVTRDSLERELQRNQWLGAFVRALGARFREADARRTDVPKAPDDRQD